MTEEFSKKINESIEQLSKMLDEFSKMNHNDPDTSRRIMLTIRVLNACMRQLILFGGMSCMKQILKLETKGENK